MNREAYASTLICIVVMAAASLAQELRSDDWWKLSPANR